MQVIPSSKMLLNSPPAPRSMRRRPKQRETQLRLVEALARFSSVTSLLLMLTAVPCQAQTVERVADIAKKITVRIEGATQGSGSLYKKEGNRYTVVTAWHVLASNNKDEEISVFIGGKSYTADRFFRDSDKSIDIGYIIFTSTSTYKPPELGSAFSAPMGSEVFVSGFPLETSSVQERVLRFSDGRVIANAKARIARGYQLLYSNYTWPGMSGGPVLNKQGQLVGIHGQSELDEQLTIERGIAVKTGTNQGIPISRLRKDVAATNKGKSEFNADDYILFSKRALSLDADKEAIFFAKKANQIQPSDKAYQYIAMASMSESVKDPRATVSNAKASLRLNPKNYHSYTLLCFAYLELSIPMQTRMTYNRLAKDACNQSLVYNKNDQDAKSFTLLLLEALNR